MTRTLSVWWDRVVVGTLQINQHGEMRFAYAAEWLNDASRPSISFSLPKQAQPFKQRQCRPFFAGLLPEESQRDVIAAALGISRGNDFAFLDAAIFNLIVGNADAHGKNFSLLYQAAGVTLAPFYDLLSTIVYPNLSPNLAMKIAKRATLEEIGSETWPAFAGDIGLAASFVRRRVRELSDAVVAEVPSLPHSPALAALDGATLTEYATLIATRAERLAKTGAR